MNRNTRLAGWLCTVSLIVSLLLGGCGSAMPGGGAEPSATALAVPVTTNPATAAATTPAGTPKELLPSAGLASSELIFARFDEPAVNLVPAVEQEPIAADLANVRVPFAIPAAMRGRLARDGFVVSPGTEKEFFTVYEKARYANEPIFVTSDSLLHVYHLLFDKVLRTAEVEYFIPLLRDLNAALLARAEDEYKVLKGTGWEEAALRTVAFVGVASKLLDPEAAVPGYAADLVEAEQTLIEQADGIQPSPLFPGLTFGEDYTQYIPRGHYTRSEELVRYFKSMMWYGRMTFRLTTDDPDVGRAETRAALLLVHALRTAEIAYRPALEAWADLYSSTVFFVGRSDDLTATQYLQVMDEVYGPDVTAASLADERLLDTFVEKAEKLPPPRILGMVIADTDDVEEMTKGLRFMGQRFVPDAYIFRKLIYRNVGTRAERRGLPKGLDLLAAMGSERAYEILDGMGETAYLSYPEQMSKVRQWVSGLSVEEWTETLYNSWLYSFHPLLEVPGDGYPMFMRSHAWLDKQLHTVLGSWAELKHDTILYAKQAYAEMGAGPMPPEPVPPKGYVEPVPQFYARLAALTAMTREGLASRWLLHPQDEPSLRRLEELARAFQTMAWKELRNEPLTEEEYTTIRFYGGELEHLTMAAADKPETGEGGPTYMDEEPQAAVIADVATDPDPDSDGVPNAVVLEEAVGRIDQIYAVVPIVEEDGTSYLQVAKGGVFSYFEFTWPADDRLTDQKWRQMLDEGQAPPRPEWIESFFTSEGESSDLAMATLHYQKALAHAVWDLSAESAGWLVRDAAYEQLRGQVEVLRAGKRYEGRQLVSSVIRSFDVDPGKQAVITTRETWQDRLYEFKEYPGGSEDGPPVGLRGPYTLDVTYTLAPDKDHVWVVTRVVYASEPPGW